MIFAGTKFLQIWWLYCIPRRQLHWSFSLQTSSSGKRSSFHSCTEIVENLLRIVWNLLQENKPWIVRILVIVSLSLAAKMRNVDLSLSDIQVNCESILYSKIHLIFSSLLKFRFNTLSLKTVTERRRFKFWRSIDSPHGIADSRYSQVEAKIHHAFLVSAFLQLVFKTRRLVSDSIS